MDVLRMRSTVLFLSILAGCDVGSLQPGGGTGTDGGGGGGDGGGNVAACVNRGTPGAAYDHGGGVTHAGENCMQAGCHGGGGGGSVYTAAGTVYKADLTTPNPGAVVRIRSGGNELTAVADSAGNFRFAQTITFPGETDVTACPNQVPMVTPLGNGDGACSRAGCHVAGAQGVIRFE